MAFSSMTVTDTHKNELERSQTITCFKGNALDCIVPPVDGKGGIYLGNRDAATNLDLLNQYKIRAVLSVDDAFNYSYFNCKVATP